MNVFKSIMTGLNEAANCEKSGSTQKTDLKQQNPPDCI